MTEGIRLNKAISDTGYCSRRQADTLIEAGKVAINGAVASLGSKVMPGDEVTINGKPIVKKAGRIYLAFHKPVGITCTTDRKIQGNIIDYIKYPERILDRKSTRLNSSHVRNSY